jgi:hypothetical protein
MWLPAPMSSVLSPMLAQVLALPGRCAAAGRVHPSPEALRRLQCSQLEVTATLNAATSVRDGSLHKPLQELLPDIHV